MNNTAIYGPDIIGPDGKVLKSPFYEYLPTESLGIIFVALYSVTTLLHLSEAFYFRLWFLLPTVGLAGIGEIIGWSGRLWSSINPLDRDPYLMQIVATILAPTPFVAALFMMFARITVALGPQYSRLSPRWYARIFLTADIISLVVQAVGGGLAASADTDADSNLGGNIMLGGIVFQSVSLTIFIIIGTEYYIRYIRDKPVPSRRSDGDVRVEWDHRLKLLTLGLILILVCVYIRSIYRTAELADGWSGVIITTEVWFDIFDGGMITLAMFTLNVFHPGFLLKTPKQFPKIQGDEDDLEAIGLTPRFGHTDFPRGSGPLYTDV